MQKNIQRFNDLGEMALCCVYKIYIYVCMFKPHLNWRIILYAYTDLDLLA